MADDVEVSDPDVGRSGTVGRRWSTRTVLTVGVVGAVALGGVALGVAVNNAGATGKPAVSCSSTTPKLTVQGTGQATAPPNLLTIVVAVNASGSSANQALASDNIKVTGAVAAFKSGGVLAKDIQTTDLSLQTQYAYPRGVPTVTGYQVTNTVTAALRDLAKAGAVIDAVVGAAGNAVQIQSVAFSFSDPARVEDEARALAVAQAVSHAKAMAHAAGRALGAVCSLTDQTLPPEPGGDENFSSAGTATSAALPVPIEAGSQSESDQITLVYALAPLSGNRGDH